jgi:pimeloyl-ACP methyl ester carboxylesterase
MLSWYRAAARWLAAPLPEDPRVRPPTLVIWGVGDPFLGREMASDSLLFCDRGSLLWFEDATHWVQHEERPRVIAAILEHLSR